MLGLGVPNAARRQQRGRASKRTRKNRHNKKKERERGKLTGLRQLLLRHGARLRFDTCSYRHITESIQAITVLLLLISFKLLADPIGHVHAH